MILPQGFGWSYVDPTSLAGQDQQTLSAVVSSVYSVADTVLVLSPLTHSLILCLASGHPAPVGSSGEREVIGQNI